MLFSSLSLSFLDSMFVLVVGVYGGRGVNPGGGLVRGYSQPVLHLLLCTAEDTENLSQVQMFCSVIA